MFTKWVLGDNIKQSACTVDSISISWLVKYLMVGIDFIISNYYYIYKDERKKLFSGDIYYNGRKWYY